MYPRYFSVALCLTAFLAPWASADTISYTGGAYAQNFAYSQDFNSLPATGGTVVNDPDLVGPALLPVTVVNPTGMQGWSYARTFGSPTRFIVNHGNINTPGVYSYGTGESSDRALGVLASDAAIFSFGAVLVNDSPDTFTEFTLSFAGEQWRDGVVASGVPNTLFFSYSLDAANISKGNFTSVEQLNFRAPQSANLGLDRALDGNLPQNRKALSATVSGISWTPGARLVLRWNDVNESGNDDGLAIDDLAFSAGGAVPGPQPQAVPLPSIAVAAAPLLAGLLLRRSRREPLP